MKIALPLLGWLTLGVTLTWLAGEALDAFLKGPT